MLTKLPFDLRPLFALDPSFPDCPGGDAHTHSAPLSPLCASLLPPWGTSVYDHTVIKKKTCKIVCVKNVACTNCSIKLSKIF